VDVVLVGHGAGRRSKHQAGVLPQISRFQPIGGLGGFTPVQRVQDDLGSSKIRLTRGFVLNWCGCNRIRTSDVLLLGSVDEQDGRAVQVGTSHRVSAFNVAERDIAGMTQQSSDALPHDRFFARQHA
jgi:hypothetical protein